MSRINTTFIYHPRSGDQVLVDRTGQDRPVVSIQYQNGCRHVYGGVQLSYWSAEPGAYCRTEARAMAQAIIEALDNGIAWDDCGNIRMVVPIRAAYAAHRRMEGVLRRHGQQEPLLQQEGVLVEAGAASLRSDNGGLALGLAAKEDYELPEEPCLRVRLAGMERLYRRSEDGEDILLQRVIYEVARVDVPAARDDDLYWEASSKVPPEWVDPDELASIKH